MSEAWDTFKAQNAEREAKALSYSAKTSWTCPDCCVNPCECKFMGGASTSTKEGVTPPAKPIGKAQIAEAMSLTKEVIIAMELERMRIAMIRFNRVPNPFANSTNRVITVKCENHILGDALNRKEAAVVGCSENIPRQIEE